MRAQDQRKLSAMGFQAREQLKIAGLDTTRLFDSTHQELLLISPKATGPSWPQVFQALVDFGPSLRILSAGKEPVVFVLDSVAARQALAQLSRAAKDSRGSEVFLENLGFSNIEQKAKFDMKNLLLPAVSVAVVITVGFILSTEPAPVENQDVQSVNETCVIDLTENEFRSWLAKAVQTQAPLSVGVTIQQATEVGDLEIIVEAVLGSAARVSGAVTCPDGRDRLVNHRIDTSGSGTVLELPN